MKILIFGGDGMLGHQLFKQLGMKHEVYVTLHQTIDKYSMYGLFDSANSFAEVDVVREGVVEKIISECRPDAVINAVGIVKQREEAEAAIPSIEINALLPHKLALACAKAGARFLHFSTDCVFSGQKGGYQEDDFPDCQDLYGRTKLLGEVQGKNAITVRTSIIGHELTRKLGLLEWFLAQKHQVKGYRNAIFSGLTTIELSRVIDMILCQYPDKHGIYHVSGDPINKYDLLKYFKDVYELSTEVVPFDEFKCDRSLDSSRFRAEFQYAPPSWEEMIEELPGSRY